MKFVIKCSQRCVKSAKKRIRGVISKRRLPCFGGLSNKMELPRDIEKLIREFERDIILEPHPTAIIMRGYFSLGVFGSCVFGVYGVCPICNGIPLLL